MQQSKPQRRRPLKCWGVPSHQPLQPPRHVLGEGRKGGRGAPLASALALPLPPCLPLRGPIPSVLQVFGRRDTAIPWLSWLHKGLVAGWGSRARAHLAQADSVVGVSGGSKWLPDRPPTTDHHPGYALVSQLVGDTGGEVRAHTGPPPPRAVRGAFAQHRACIMQGKARKHITSPAPAAPAPAALHPKPSCRQATHTSANIPTGWAVPVQAKWRAAFACTCAGSLGRRQRVHCSVRIRTTEFAPGRGNAAAAERQRPAGAVCSLRPGRKRFLCQLPPWFYIYVANFTKVSDCRPSPHWRVTAFT
jgi:hypothetical protein